MRILNKSKLWILQVALIIAALPTLLNAGFKEGDRLPDLTTFKLEGTLPKDVKGKVVLLDFWASWCEPCKKSFPAMEELRRQYGDQGLTIIAVSVDEKQADMDQFLESVKVTFSTLRDANQKLVGEADVPTMPTSFLVDRSGSIRFIHKGFTGDETVKQYKSEIEQLLKEAKP